MSAFGLGGTNAHVLLEEYVPPAEPGLRPTPGQGVPQVVQLSARNEERLRAYARQLAHFVGGFQGDRDATGDTEPALADIAYTLRVGRDAMAHRLALVARTTGELAGLLGDFLDGRASHGVLTGYAVSTGDDAVTSDDDPHTAARQWVNGERPGGLRRKGAPRGGCPCPRIPSNPGATGRNPAPSPKTPPGPVGGAPRAQRRADVGRRGGTAHGRCLVNSKETRRQILERVGNGNLSVAEATALLRGATVAPTAPGGSLVVFRPGWQLTCPAPPERLPPARRTLVVLGEAVPDSLTLPAGTVAVRATPGTGWESRGTDRYDVGTADDSGWTGLWAQLRAVERLPERVVLVTGAAAENCLDTAYPLVRTLIRDRTGDAGTALALVAVGPDSGPTADALGGFCTVAAQEDRRLRLLAMALPGPAPDPVRLALAELEEPVPGLAEIRYDTEGRWVRTVAPADPTAPETPLSLPDGGVYLLAGGAGGIGLAVAALLGERTRGRTVLMGRAEPDARIREALARIEAGGGRARYVQGDVTSRQDVVRAVAFARSEFGALTGVVHLAGVNEDTYIVNKEPGAQRRVLGPRIAGARFLDEATRAEPLELFVLCSTMSGYVGHAGQSDYAAAGRALGGFAVRRAEAVRRGERAGHTVSIAWPLWADGGMRLGRPTGGRPRPHTACGPCPPLWDLTPCWPHWARARPKRWWCTERRAGSATSSPSGWRGPPRWRVTALRPLSPTVRRSRSRPS